MDLPPEPGWMYCPCDSCSRKRALANPRREKEATERAESLLASYLIPEQLEDWKARREFNVRGPSGLLYRIGPSTLLRHDGQVSNVWATGLGIAADKAVAMLFWVAGDEQFTWDKGCKDSYVAAQVRVHDYGGKL